MSIVYTVGTFTDNSFNCYNQNKSLFDPLGIGVSLKNTVQNVSTGTLTNNCFIIGYDASNNVKWANKMGGFSNSLGVAYSVCTDLQKSVYVTGYTIDASFQIYDSSNQFVTLTYPGILSQGAYYGFIVKYDNNGKYVWATYFTPESSVAGSITPTSICTDLNNNVYVGGYFTGKSIFAYDISGYFITHTASGNVANYSCFLVSYKSTGQTSWLSIMDDGDGEINTHKCSLFSITTNLTNNVYVSGTFNYRVFNLHNATNNINKVLYNNVSDPSNTIFYSAGFLAKYNSSGDVIWATKTASQYYSGGIIRLPLSGGASTLNGSLISGVCCDYNNNVYISGTFGDASYNFYDNNGINPLITINNTAASTTNATNYYTNGFVAKYNNDGTVLCVTRIGGIGQAGSPYDKAIDIDVDLSNNIYVTGQFNDIICELFNFTSDGTLQVGKTLLNTSVGKYTPYNVNGFIVKYSGSTIPDVIWAYRMGGFEAAPPPESQAPSPLVSSALGVSLDSSNNVYVSGVFNDQSFNIYNFDNHGGLYPYFTLENTSHPSSIAGIATANNSFLCKYNQDGDLISATNMGGDGYPGTPLYETIASGSIGYQTSANKINFAPPAIVCFKEDTKILTNKGYKIINNLRKGDLVKTLMNGFVPINMIGKKEIYHHALDNRIKDQLYKCSKDKFPELFEDLIITGCHSILIDKFKDDEQIKKATEINGHIYITDGKYRLPACIDERTTVYEKPGYYEIYHIALDNSDYYMNYGIFANGLLVETCSKRYLKELSNMELIE